MSLRKLNAITLLAGLAGCVGQPDPQLQQPLVAVPGAAKPEAEFRADDSACRTLAAETPVNPQQSTVAGSSAALTSTSADKELVAQPIPNQVGTIPAIAVYLRCMRARGNEIQPMTAPQSVLYGYYPAYSAYGGYGGFYGGPYDYYPYLFGDFGGFGGFGLYSGFGFGRGY